jgi:predicted RNase H-like HicB family nuclease
LTPRRLSPPYASPPRLCDPLQFSAIVGAISKHLPNFLAIAEWRIANGKSGFDRRRVRQEMDPIHHEQTAGFSNDARGRNIAAMKFVTSLERDEDGTWVAECPSIPGCVSQGKTREEALENIREAIAACLEVRAERGLPLTVETQQVEVRV